MKNKKMNKWKDHFQYLISFDLLSAKERLPNALNDACRLLFKENTTIQSKMRTVYETSLYLYYDYFYYLPVKGKPTKIQILEEEG